MVSAAQPSSRQLELPLITFLREINRCATRFFWDLVATMPYHVIGALSTLGSSGSVQMLTVAICKIPICIRLFRLAHKLDEVTPHTVLRPFTYALM